MLLKQVLRAASGWLELGMPGEALEELEGVDAEAQGDQRYLEVKLAAQMAMEAWPEAFATARLLCVLVADDPDFFLKAAFCLHEMGATVDAKDWLLAGPKVLNELPVFHYNLACYYWVLGDGNMARDHLDQAIKMDGSFLESAREDRDLVGMEI